MHGATSQAVLAVTSLLAFALNQLSVAKKHECMATETSDGTFYSVPAPKCSRYHYSWSNSSDNVLANSDGKAEELVKSSNGTFLHTYRCYETIKHIWDCYDKWKKEIMICEIKCSQSSGVHGSHYRGFGNGAGRWRHLIPVPLILLSVLLATFIL